MLLTRKNISFKILVESELRLRDMLVRGNGKLEEYAANFQRDRIIA